MAPTWIKPSRSVRKRTLEEVEKARAGSIWNEVGDNTGSVDQEKEEIIQKWRSKKCTAKHTVYTQQVHSALNIDIQGFQITYKKTKRS
jgi:hypothetical protein